MQELSFIFKNPSFTLNAQRFSVMVYTFCNAYALDIDETTVSERKDGVSIHSDGLCWAGGQEKVVGTVDILATIVDSGVRFSICAAMGNAGESIRCVKLSLHDIADGELINLINATPRAIPEAGLNLKYPEGWRDVGTPLLILRGAEGTLNYYKSWDNQVRDKRFVFTRDGGTLTAELIFEEIATRMSNSITVPDWEIGIGDTVEAIYKPHVEHLECSYGLQSWETRPDVPDWARKISLVAAIHCQHWTGYVFNDYEAVLDKLSTLCTMIEGKRILAYLPGWEGRYYWKYGNYSPDERMGGESGFKKLCDGANELGVHLMPMFGINIVGTHFDGYREWGATSEFCGPSGNVYGGSVDWDGSRHFDHGSNRNLNPAAPKWQNRLYGQVTELMDRYGFDAVFFDIAACWTNDPNHYLYEGVKQLMSRLKAHNPNLLLSGEAWYDAIASAIPLVQSGHTDGVLHWHDDAYAPVFDKYSRGFGHLCLGDPSRGSTGVHEQGTNPIWRCSLRNGVIPTITIVEDSLTAAPEKTAQIIADAREYAEKFLEKGK